MLDQCLFTNQWIDRQLEGRTDRLTDPLPKIQTFTQASIPSQMPQTIFLTTIEP